MKDQYKVMISSDSNYEKLVAEIYCNEDLIAQVIQDEGFDKLQIKTFDSAFLMNLEEFNSAIVSAVNKLKN